MIESISRETDLDSLDGQAMVRFHYDIEKLGVLRTDLKALLRYTNSGDLATALSSTNTNQVLEIGVADKFEALVSIYRALSQSRPDFSPSQIMAADAKLDLDVWPEYQDVVKRITTRKSHLQDILAETTGRFDLILAKGVVSVGAGIELEPPDVLDTILGGIRESLNPSNSNAMAILSSKQGLLLPFSRTMLRRAGLEPVYFMAPTVPDRDWEEILAGEGKLDPKPFKLVICHRVK